MKYSIYEKLEALKASLKNKEMKNKVEKIASSKAHRTVLVLVKEEIEGLIDADKVSDYEDDIGTIAADT
jgi:hypothetical protein